MLMETIYNLHAITKSCVKMNGKLSYYFKYNIGVRQGENLSPLLCGIFLNDFEYSISGNYSGLDLQADDVNVCLGNYDMEHWLKIYTFCMLMILLMDL